MSTKRNAVIIQESFSQHSCKISWWKELISMYVCYQYRKIEIPLRAVGTNIKDLQV